MTVLTTEGNGFPATIKLDLPIGQKNWGQEADMLFNKVSFIWKKCVLFYFFTFAVPGDVLRLAPSPSLPSDGGEDRLPGTTATIKIFFFFFKKMVFSLPKLLLLRLWRSHWKGRREQQHQRLQFRGFCKLADWHCLLLPPQ